MNYNVVSSDDHVQEPGDLWTKRVPTKLRDRAPRLERRPEGDIWMIEGKPTMGLSLSVQAGKKFEEYKAAGVLWEETRPGCYDPAARLKDMDIDGVDAQVLFPNLAIAEFYNMKDLELQLACLHAYNDFMSDFCG